MQQLIHQQWCAKVFCRYEDPTCQRPDPLTFLDEYRAYLHQQPAHQMPILTGPALKETLSSGGSAGGVDGWRTPELQALPTWMWNFAAELWNAIMRAAQDHAEQHGALVPCESLRADFFLKGYCPLLDKGEGPEPLRQRALTIITRLYGSGRLSFTHNCNSSKRNGSIPPYQAASDTETPSVQHGK